MIKKFATNLLAFAFSVSCAHSKKVEEEKTPERAPGYGDFLFIPHDSMMIRNFIDNDGDNVDDRFQLQPKGKAYPVGHFYKKTK